MTPITTTAELAVFCNKLKGQPVIASKAAVERKAEAKTTE